MQDNKFPTNNILVVTPSHPIFISDYDYPLPDERIAKFPLPRRDASKLLVYRQGQITESRFHHLAGFLPADCLLVYNNTRVIQARLVFRKATGARIEVFCLEPAEPADYALSLGSTALCTWKCMVGNLKKWKTGALARNLDTPAGPCRLTAELASSEGNTHEVRFAWDNPGVHFAQVLECAGELPIPPYLHRATEESDKVTYQTVYSHIEGSVAAPTAGLHFTAEVFDSQRAKGIETEELTLHVGAGTFQPVKSATAEEHPMHAEVIEVNRAAIEHLIRRAGHVIAVGTTSVRTLESLYYIGLHLLRHPDETTFRIGQWEPYETDSDTPATEALQAIVRHMERRGIDRIHASTRIMIKPGYRFRVVNGIITNFHQPKSTLLLLVSAFVQGDWRTIYDYALAHDFRFLSYGDSSLLLP